MARLGAASPHYDSVELFQGSDAGIGSIIEQERSVNTEKLLLDLDLPGEGDDGEVFQATAIEGFERILQRRAAGPR